MRGTLHCLLRLGAFEVRFLATRSPVGPNLVASIATIVLVTAHNEARIVQKAELKHEDLHEVLREIKNQIVHPIEEFQDSVADAVVDKLDEDAENPS